MPNNKNENEGINMNKKTERYEEEEELINKQTFSEKNKINTKIKSNQIKKDIILIMEVIQMDIIIMVVGNYLGIVLERKIYLMMVE